MIKSYFEIISAVIILSILFLVSYIAHHLLAGDSKFGGEGVIRYIYYFILVTHIFLAAVILPFILFTAYRGLTAEFAQHMMEKGVYVVAFSYPVVPKGKARIRTQVCASHTKEDIDFIVKCFIEVREEMGLNK